MGVQLTVMPRTLLTGATGRLGRALRPTLREAGHDVRAASRSPPEDGDGEWVTLDLADGEGLDAAVAGADVIVHAASAPTGDAEAVDVAGTERLVAAAADAGVSHFLYVSIVGVDDVPFSYYQHKLTAEGIVEAGDVPWTIVRATQFHSFVDEILGTVARLPVWPLPTRFRVQPVDVREVADRIVDHAGSEAAGRVPPVGGPEVRTLGEFAESYRAARGLRRPIVRLPLPGGTARAFRAGAATRPDRAVGTVTWEAWLADRYGGAEETAVDSTGSPT